MKQRELGRWRRRKSRRGTSLVELMAVAFILAFVAIGTMSLYRVGDQQQRTARFYSDAQSVVREAIRRMTRTVRHSRGVVVGSSVTNFSAAPNSTTSQIIVATPEPGTTGTEYIRFYLSGTTLYAQRHDDTGAGLAIATGVQSMTISYYVTSVDASGLIRTSVNGAPATATEVQVSLVVKSGTVTTTEAAYVELRNYNLSLI
jgi:Tfp pilus assembly protein PilW